MSAEDWGIRVWDGIESRLASPCEGALEAYERLRDNGEAEQAERLMAAMQTFTDEARAIRRELTDRRAVRA